MSTLPYAIHNLVKYEDAILLHFSEKMKTAWLTLKNYSSVFGTDTPDAVAVVTVGTPSDKEYQLAFSLSQFLNFADVIKLQIAILTNTFLADGPVEYTCPALMSILQDSLERVDSDRAPYTITLTIEGQRPYRTITNSLTNILKLFPGSTLIQNCFVQNGPQNEGFSFFFPKPSLILQEQSTEKLANKPGKTNNKDTRDILIIPCNRKTSSGFHMDSVVAHIEEGLDERAAAYKKQNPGKSLPLDLCSHTQIKRVNCFAFRGDSRPPYEIQRSDSEEHVGGFMAGITRTDDAAFYETNANGLRTKKMIHGPDGGQIWIKDLAEKLDAALEKTVKGTDDEAEAARQDINPEYLKLLKDYNLAHLGIFLNDQTFKTYLSTTRSTAIAKCFANKWSAVADVITYCYACRCIGGLYLDSFVPDGVPAEDYNKHIQHKHGFNSFCEQEVAMTGAIWSENIVGARIIQCNSKGQFFFGPIMLKEVLMREDNDAFSELFELFSGKSQGEAKGVVEPTYQKNNVLWPTPFAHVATSGANSLSPVTIPKRPQAMFSCNNLEFRGLAIDVSSSNTISVTNVGPGKLTLQPAQIGGQNPKDFSIRSPLTEVQAGESHTVYVTFQPKELGKRTAVVTFNHDGEGEPYPITLTGTGVAAKPGACFAHGANPFDLKKVAKGFANVPVRILLMNTGNCLMYVDTEKTEITGDFSVNRYQPGTIDPHDHFVLPVTFKPLKTGKREGLLRVFLQDGTSYETELVGEGQKAKLDLELSSTKPLNLTITSSTPKPKESVTLINHGNIPCLATVAIAGKKSDDFQIESADADGKLSFELGSGGSRKIVVLYKPTIKGKHQAKLTITYTIEHYEHSGHEIALSGSS